MWSIFQLLKLSPLLIQGNDCIENLLDDSYVLIGDALVVALVDPNIGGGHLHTTRLPAILRRIVSSQIPRLINSGHVKNK